MYTIDMTWRFGFPHQYRNEEGDLIGTVLGESGLLIRTQERKTGSFRGGLGAIKVAFLIGGSFDRRGQL